MTDVRSSKIRSNLSRKMAQPGGRTIADAVARAESGVAGHQDDAMRRLAVQLDALEALGRDRPAGCETQVYDQAAAFLDMAGFFDTGPLYTAAFSLCELSDRMIAQGVWDWPSVAVHLRALRLILSTGCVTGTASDEVLKGLAAVARRYA